VSDGVIITVVWTLKPEAVDGFRARISEGIKETATHRGLRSIRVSQRDNRFLVIQHWDSQGEFDEYVAWHRKKGSMDAIAGIIAAPPAIDSWSLIAKEGG
jgi:quinol monooxygenase YgiN